MDRATWINSIVAQAIGAPPGQVAAAVKLLDEGATEPFLPRIPFDVGEFEELALRMAPAERAAHRAWIAVAAIEMVVSAIGIGLEHALPPREIPVRVRNRSHSPSVDMAHEVVEDPL